MDYERILAIGDMHGNFDRLLSVFHKVRWNPQKDLLIFLGDYVDRGPENLRCLRWAMEMSEKENVIALRGNHEQMMLAYYLLERDSEIWLPNGGYKTEKEMNEWQKKDPKALERVLKFIAARPLYHRVFVGNDEYIFCHAGLKPGVPIEQQTDEDLLWIREEFYMNYRGAAKVIVGHTPVQYISLSHGLSQPLKLQNNVTMLDTGSFLPNGKISCMDVLSGKFYQSDS